jgi:uncharacterized damage-inducible protein DinB
MIMKIQDIQLIFDYNYWANKRLLAAASNINPEQFASPLGFPHGSLRGTLLHTLDAEYGWRVLCEHGVEAEDLAESDFPTISTLEKRWQVEEAAMHTYLVTLKDDDMSRIIRYTNPGGLKRERVLWHCLFHVVNHGTQHRSEAAAILTGMGRSPGDFDFSIFMLVKN